MFSNSSHYCFRHSSFMFTASSESILMLRGSCNFLLCGITYIPLHIKPCFLHEHLAEWESVLQLHFTKDYKCIHNLWFHYVKQVHCCIWNYVRKEWHFAVDDVWSNLQGSFTDVQVNNFGIYSSGGSVFKPSHRHTTVPPYNRTRASSPYLQVFFLFFFFFFCLFVLFFFLSCEFDFLVNTFAWFRNRGDSFSFCTGQPFPTEKRLLVMSWPPTVWPNMIWWSSRRGLYSSCCLDYFYVPDFGCRLWPVENKILQCSG